MNRNVFISTIFLFFTVPAVFCIPWKSPYAAPPVTPPAHVHPRVMFRQQDLVQILENMQTPEEAAAFAAYRNDPGDTGIYASFISRKGRTYTFDGAVLAHIEDAAFHYATEKDPRYAAYAYGSLTECCRTMETEGIFDTYRPVGQLMFTAAEVYDWCYEALSEIQKKDIVDRILALAAKMEIGCPPGKQGAVVGHGSEAQLLRNYLAFAAAVYDERPDIWNYVAGRFYQEYVPVREFYYHTGLPGFQGSNYGPYRSSFDLWAALLVIRMGYVNPFGTGTDRWTDAFLYYERPDGQMWRIGDDTGERHRTYTLSSYAVNAFYSSVLSENAAVKGYAEKNLDHFTKFQLNSNGESDDTLTPVQFMIFDNPLVPSSSPGNLPVVRYNGSPMGEYFARGSWTDPGTPAVHMKIGELNSGNHEHRDGGTFEIFCNGILASDSGYYTSGGGTAGYGAAEVQTYLHGTVAHNCILVEPEKVTADDYGGQKTVSEPGTLESWLENSDAARGSVTVHADRMDENGTGYVYLAGDLTRAYPHAESVTRSMLSVFTGDRTIPFLFFVYDTVIPEDGSHGVFLLHMQDEPQIAGNSVIITNRQNTRLVSTTMLPEKPVFTLIGGPGKQYIVAGRNYEPAVSIPADYAAEPGWGRVEIRYPQRDENAAAAVEHFLHAMAVVSGSAAGNQHLASVPEAVLLKAGGFDGAFISGRAVYFPQKASVSTFSATLPGSDGSILTVFVCNLQPGRWQLSGIENGPVFMEAGQGSRLLEFTARAGTAVELQHID
jgi:hypothetical protein